MTATLCVLVLVMGQAPSEVHSPRDGKFTVKFPGKPKETKQTVKSDIGDLKVTTSTYASADGATWWVTYTDYPKGATAAQSQLLDGVRDALRGDKGKVVNEKDVVVTSAKLAGREVVLDRGKDSVRCRLVLRGDRLFQVVVLGTGEFVTGKDATAFLDSFDVK